MVDTRLQQVMQPGSGGSLFEGHRKGSLQSSDEIYDSGRLGLQQTFHDQLARSIHHRHRDGGLVHVHPDILFLIHKGAPFR